MSNISSGITVGTALVNEGNTDGTLVLRTNGTTTALTLGTDQSATFAGKATISGGLNENQVDLTGTSPVIDCSAGNVFALTTSGSPTSLTASNVPTTGTAYGFILKLTAGGSHTIDYSGLGTVRWQGGVIPTPPALGETDILGFITYDAGSTWYGFLAGDAMA